MLLEEDWNIVASFLSDFCLVVVQSHTDNSECLLDCHPLIREYFAKQLREGNTESCSSGHLRLYQYLKDSVITIRDG